MSVVSDYGLKRSVDKMRFSQVSGVYWLCKSMHSWNNDLVTTLESHAVKLLKKEIQIQNELEKDYEADVPEGLQTMRLADVQMVLNYY